MNNQETKQRPVPSSPKMAEECGLKIDLNKGFEIVSQFYSNII